MKRTHKIKKVLRNTLLVLLTTFSFFVFSSAPKAATNSGAGTVQKSSTTYGTYSWMYSKAGILQSLEGSTTNWSTMSVVIDLNAYYSGNLTITISGVSNFANIGIFVQGAYIAQKSTNQVQVQLVYSNKVIIEFYSTTPYVSTSYNWSCAVGVGTLNKIDDFEASSLDNIDSTVSNISAAITSNTYGLPAIYNKLDSIEDAIDTLTSINNSLSDLNSYASYNHNNNLSSLTIRFNNDSNYSYENSSYNNFTYYRSFSSPISLTRIDTQFGTTSEIDNYLVLKYLFRCNSAQSNPLANFSLVCQQPTNNNWFYITNFRHEIVEMTSINSYLLTLYVPFSKISSFISSNSYKFILNNLDFTNLSMSSFIFGGFVSSLPLDLDYLNLLQQIATGIGNISQQQIVENNTNINNYNNYQQQINNVENNYYQQFNNIETNIENNNTFDFTGLSTDGVQVYHNMFSQVYGISLVKWPVLITLLGLVIVIILG